MLAALPGGDYLFTVGAKLNFTDVETFSSLSLNDLVIPIIDDDIAEQCESFICTLQGGAQDAVRTSEPNQVMIRISDDDCEHMHRFSSNVHIVHTMGAYRSPLLSRKSLFQDISDYTSSNWSASVITVEVMMVEGQRLGSLLVGEVIGVGDTWNASSYLIISIFSYYGWYVHLR